MEVVEKIGQRTKKHKARIASVLPDYKFSWEREIVDGPRGPRTVKESSLSIFRRGDETQIPVPRSALAWHQRKIVAELEKEQVESHTRLSPCRATWCNLLTDLGMDMLDLSGGEYIDADTIPTALDTPTMYIQMSDLISFGFLLDMEVNKFEVRERFVDMVGKHCTITTYHQLGVGILTRYSGLPPKVHPSAFDCSPSELSMLLHTARGAIQVGDSLADIADWGFNAVDRIFSAAHDKARGDEWQKVDIEDVMIQIEPDSDIQWQSRWSKPTVPVLPFVLSLCSNMAVANAFPHRNLDMWAETQRKTASQTAFQHIQDGIGFVEAPTTLFKIMKDKNLDLVVMDDFKTANNWGCESGGMRGWLVTNFAEFAVRLSKCWEVPGMMDGVPILPHFKPLFADGTLNERWGRHYNAKLRKEDKAQGWRMRANTLLWLQIMMFDTWIARRVELIMTGSSSVDVSVPVDTKSAVWAASRIENKPLITGWKRSRLAFTRLYLARLAEGVNGKAASCMTGSSEKLPPEIGWNEMYPGSDPEDWADVDAVLTLRAVVMVVRLELMKDSSALLEVRELDPIVQLA
jgi:hypothetical protein